MSQGAHFRSSLEVIDVVAKGPQPPQAREKHEPRDGRPTLPCLPPVCVPPAAQVNKKELAKLFP